MSHATDRRSVSLQEPLYERVCFAAEHLTETGDKDAKPISRTALVRMALEAYLALIPDPPEGWHSKRGRGGRPPKPPPSSSVGPPPKPEGPPPNPAKYFTGWIGTGS